MSRFVSGFSAPDSISKRVAWLTTDASRSGWVSDGPVDPVEEKGEAATFSERSELTFEDRNAVLVNSPKSVQ